MAKRMSDKSRIPEGEQADNQIDENLKRIYDNIVEDEVPERFAKLIDQLREQEENLWRLNLFPKTKSRSIPGTRS